MIVIGITGPSGAGKGELSRILREKYGFPVLNADEIYHSLVSALSPCLEEIRKEFGDCVITENGSLDRRALSQLVFGEPNKERLITLNKITHKHVVKAIEDMINILDNKAKACIIDAPLLIEAGLCKRCDITFCVLAPVDLRAARISQRDGINIIDAQKRINSQKDDSFYVNNTDITLKNDGDISLLSAQIENVIQERRILE